MVRFLRGPESYNTSLTFNFSRYDRKRIFIMSGMGMKKKITEENFTAPDQTEVWR